MELLLNVDAYISGNADSSQKTKSLKLRRYILINKRICIEWSCLWFESLKSALTAAYMHAKEENIFMF